MADIQDVRIEAYLSGAWVDLTDDVLGEVAWKYGIEGNSPADCVASPGEMTFDLDNSEENSAATLGYYSPTHASVRAGWTFGVPIRLILENGSPSTIKFTGKVYGIDPDPGEARERRVHVVAQDRMADLLDAEVRGVGVLTDVSESDALDALLDAVAADAQPAARDLDMGANQLPVVFDDLDGGQSFVRVAHDLVVSAQGRFFLDGTGTARYRNRHNLGPLNPSAVTLDDTMLQSFSSPTSVERCFNKFQITVHRKTVSVTATDELYSGVVELGAGESQEVWCDYTDPTSGERRTRVGGVDVVTSLTAGVHYYAGVVEGGSTLTGNITASLEAFSSTAKYTIENTGTVTAYVTLKVIGKAVRDLGPQLVERSSTQAYGERRFKLDLPYQHDVSFAGDLGTILLGQHETLANQMDGVMFLANDSDALLAQALAREPGDRVTLSETVTGYSTVDAVIQLVAFRLTEAGHLWTTWEVAPVVAEGSPWVLGTSELENETELAL